GDRVRVRSGPVVGQPAAQLLAERRDLGVVAVVHGQPTAANRWAASAAYWACSSPNTRREVCARRSQRWGSASHVIPMPPWICTAACVTSTAASAANAFAERATSTAAAVSSSSAAHAEYQTALRVASTSTA